MHGPISKTQKNFTWTGIKNLAQMICFHYLQTASNIQQQLFLGFELFLCHLKQLWTFYIIKYDLTIVDTMIMKILPPQYPPSTLLRT